MSFTVRESCALCSGALEKVLDLHETPLANEYPDKPSPDQDRFPLFLAVCRDCGHIQMPVVVSPERMFREYRYVSGTTLAVRQHLTALARDMMRDFDYRPFVVEIGANDGTLLQELKNRGAKVLGVDPAYALAADASARGLPTLPTFFTQAAAEGILSSFGRARYIVGLNVCAHTADLTEMMHAARLLIDAHYGEIIIEVGAADSVLSGVFDVIYHEHLHFHAPDPFARFLAQMGLAFREEPRKLPTQGGSWRFTCNARSGKAQGTTRHDWAAVRSRVERHRERLREAVLSRRVALYGVPAKATTLLHYCGLTDAIEFAVDDNPLKVGRYVPGTKIEILSPDALGKRKPHALLLASWNFADEIRARHGTWGGEWIVPFSEAT